MELVIEDSRYAFAQIEKSRGSQDDMELSFIVQLWYSEEPKMYVQIIKRNIITVPYVAHDIAKRVGGDEVAEAILVELIDEPSDGAMVRKAFNKLDSLSFENFIGDWCIEQGGYQVLDIKGEEK